MSLPTNVTRLGDLLDFEQFFKAFGRNYFAQISHILRQFLLIFLAKSFLGNFYRLLAIFFWSHCSAYLFQFAWLKDKLGPKNKYDIAETLVIKSSSLETIDQPNEPITAQSIHVYFSPYFWFPNSLAGNIFTLLGVEPRRLLWKMPLEECLRPLA